MSRGRYITGIIASVFLILVGIGNLIQEIDSLDRDSGLVLFILLLFLLIAVAGVGMLVYTLRQKKLLSPDGLPLTKAVVLRHLWWNSFRIYLFLSAFSLVGGLSALVLAVQGFKNYPGPASFIFLLGLGSLLCSGWAVVLGLQPARSFRRRGGVRLAREVCVWPGELKKPTSSGKYPLLFDSGSYVIVGRDVYEQSLTNREFYVVYLDGKPTIVFCAAHWKPVAELMPYFSTQTPGDAGR